MLCGSSRTCFIGNGSTRGAAGFDAYSSAPSNGGVSGARLRRWFGAAGGAGACGDGVWGAGTAGMEAAAPATAAPNARRVTEWDWFDFRLLIKAPTISFRSVYLRTRLPGWP